ncbi:MAG: hypothetical protein GQ570_00715 [Helicobacteraceae bacterium]|nr:hypothetical protein [Helicobacteraceae bacterium]
MNFSEYMNEWLYGKNGYYSKYKQIGKGGDFYTAVSSSKFFGGAIAKHIISLVDEKFLAEDTTICEIGAHHGYLLADIIEFIYTLRPQLLKTFSFAIVERFDNLQEQQQTYFKESFGDVINLQQYKSLDELSVNSAFFIANEIFDAFACELYYKGKIATVKDHKIEFDLENDEMDTLAKKQNRDRGELAIDYKEFATSMYKSAKKFEFMSFDYGEMNARSDFSIRVYKDHEVIPLFDENINLKELFANSDITYDVVFEQVKEDFEKSGMKMVEFKAQLTALVNMGIMELLEMLKDKTSQELYAQELSKVKQLIMPSFMGERFKMIRFRKEL